MNATNKTIIACVWIIVCALAVYAFPYIRDIGTTWVNDAGFLRMIGLTAYCALLIFAPVIMAILALFGQPALLYKKLGDK